MKMSFIVSMGPSINDLKRKGGHKLTKKLILLRIEIIMVHICTPAVRVVLD